MLHELGAAAAIHGARSARGRAGGAGRPDHRGQVERERARQTDRQTDKQTETETETETETGTEREREKKGGKVRLPRTGREREGWEDQITEDR